MGISKRKKIIIDMLLNIVATAVPTVVLQLIILPLLSKSMPDQSYGLIVTILAILNVVPSTIGNALNNVRLINQKDIDDNASTDYNVLLTIFSTISFMIVLALCIFYDKNYQWFDLFLTSIVSLLWLLREYYIVAFRIKINYGAIVISNIVMVIGYAIGYVVYYLFNFWQFIYIFGLGISLLYIIFNSKLFFEPFKISKKFKGISKQTIFLIVSNILSRFTTYADKMLVYPILGGYIVSVYYAATIFGKVISLAITPISSVMLSYLSVGNEKESGSFNSSLLIGSVSCVIGYFICLIISRPLLSIIYPRFVDDAMIYVGWTTATVVVTALISIVNPYVLKFLDMKYQIFINGGSAIFYIILTMVFLKLFGLTGFCIGAFIANLIKLAWLIILYKQYLNKATGI